MAATLFDYVDIGGECFNVTGTTDSPPPPTERNNTKTYDLICKSKTEFYKTFTPILVPGDLRLIRTYLPYQHPQLQGIQEHEKKPLKTLIEKRMEILKSSSENSNSINKGQFLRYHDNLKKLLKDIESASATLSTTSLDTLQERVKSKFSKERVYYILMELAWYLLHPTMIKSNSDSWMKLLDTIETLNLGAVVKSIHDSKQHTMKIDVDRVEEADEIGKGLSPPDDSAELKRRLESILQLFVMRRYLKEPIRKNEKGPLVNDETIGALKSKLPLPMKGGKSNTGNTNSVSNSFQINSESMASMMKPFYDFFKQKYEPITSVLSTPLPDELSLVSLSKLLFICQKITSQSPIHHGVYRITNMDPAMIEFIRTQLGSVQAHVKQMEADGKDVKSFTDEAGLVPVVSIKSLLNKFGKSGHYTDPDTIPTVRIMMMGINLEPSTTQMEFDKDAHRLDFEHAVGDFFEDQAIYLVCNEATSTQTPMNVAKVDYQGVNVSKDTWVLDELTDHYFNEVRNPPLFLETVMDVNPNIIFNHGMLALSMFIASEELLPK
jgi:hypothetical protein